jgi:hypothetical protein
MSEVRRAIRKPQQEASALVPEGGAVAGTLASRLRSLEIY